MDFEFYKMEDIGADKLRILGVFSEVAEGQNKTSGEYYTGRPGRQPEWNTDGGFWWKLSLKKLDDVLEYISRHPKATDSMLKSSFIFPFLQMNESHLSGDVYIGGSTPNKRGVYSDIISTLRNGGSAHRYYGSAWNGKWLYTESGDLVSPNEISKRDLNPQLYGEVRFDSYLYEMLGFSKNAADQIEDAVKDYDTLSDEKKERFFEIEFRRRFGIPVSEGEEILEGKVSERDLPYTVADNSFEFPSSKIKNWESLRKHAAEVLVYASPVKYEYKVRHICVSKPVAEVRAYLKGMYKVEGKYKYACQMCHEAFPDVDACRIQNKSELELDAAHLCLCPICAREYKKMRVDEDYVEVFMHNIASMSNEDIMEEDPVEMLFQEEKLWFTQSHIAEIRELLNLREEADAYKSFAKKGNESRQMSIELEEEETEDVSAGTDVYKDYVGKRVYHKGHRGHGTVISCDGKYIEVDFEDGVKAGSKVKFLLETCLQKSLLQII